MPSEPQREAARIDRLLTIADGHEPAMVRARIEREQKSDPHLSDVLGLIDDHAGVALAVALPDQFERADPRAARSRAGRPLELMTVLLVGRPHPFALSRASAGCLRHDGEARSTPRGRSCPDR